MKESWWKYEIISNGGRQGIKCEKRTLKMHKDYLQDFVAVAEMFDKYLFL